MLRTIRDKRSIVAIDPTPRGIAFVFFERAELMDWGTRTKETEDETEIAIVDRLIGGCAADILILEDPGALGCRRRESVRKALREIARHVRRRGIEVIAVSRQEVRRAWAERAMRSKEAVAQAIASEFPELLPLVPPRRKITRSEDARVNLFDALSLLLHAKGRDLTP